MGLYYDTAKIIHGRESVPWGEANSVDAGMWVPWHVEKTDEDQYLYTDYGPKWEFTIHEDDTVVCKPMMERANRSTHRYTALGWVQKFSAQFAGRQLLGITRTAYKGYAVGDFTKSNAEREAVYVFTPHTFITPTAIHNLAILPVRKRWVGSPEIGKYVTEKVKQLTALYRILNFEQLVHGDDPRYRNKNELRDKFNWKTFADWDGMTDGGDIAAMCALYAYGYSHSSFSFRKQSVNKHIVENNMKRWVVAAITMGELYKQVCDYQMYRADYSYPYAPVPYQIVPQ